MVDALAPGAEEGRGKLRKGTGKSKHLLSRTCPNGATRQEKSCHPKGRQTRGTETSKYPEEEKSNEIPKVAASEMGTSPNRITSVVRG